jgi:hypothetical protein
VAFEERGLTFHKTRVANLFLRKLADGSSTVLDEGALARFERIIERLNQTVERIRTENRKGFR